ncbi:MAG: AbrB/MazE/SpoVT family DNA-binding domain-containing protein [Elusimicrobia bacterium]|nr:AbrB/MazE/SpoVT family DNA-binding domain-containing protein [Elusimicrobiota bacterium]
MTRVTVSSKFQIVIPKEIRGQAHLKKGERLVALFKDGVITLVPEHPLKSLRGAFPGMDGRDVRDKRDRA